MTNNFKASKSFKRLISTILCTSVILGTMVQSFAFKVSDDIKGTAFEESATILGALNIMVGHPDGTFKPEDGLKRSEFAKIAVHALGEEQSAQSAQNQIKFSDLTTDYWANGYINVAASMNVILGDPDGKVRPEDKISYQEAVTVLVRMAGYEPAAESKGGYPNGYLTVASQYGFRKNAPGQGSEVISRGVASILTNNTLTIGIMEQTGFGTNTDYTITEKNILGENLDTVKKAGQVTGNYFTKLNGTSNTEKSSIEIDNVVYKTTDAGAQNYLGYKVNYYLQTNSSNEEKVILVMSEKNKNEILTIDGENIATSLADKITYWKNKNTDASTKTAKLSEKAIMIYNGKSVEYNHELIKTDGKLKGMIELLDNDNDGINDIVFVNEFKNLVVESTSALSYTVTDKYGKPSLQFNPDDTSVKFTLKDTAGNDVEFKDLEEWQVISYLGSKSDGIIIAIVNDKVVEGKVAEIQDGEYKIDGKFYKTADNYEDEIKLDDQGAFYLDVMGRIAAVDANASLSDKYAYLVDAVKADGLDDFIKLKLFNLKGETEVLTSTSKLGFNSSTKIVSADVLKKLTGENGKVVNQLVTYEVNSDGKVSRINTAEDLSANDTTTVQKDKFTLNFKAEDAIYKKAGSKLDIFNITDKTVVFDIPTAAQDEDDYAIKDKSMFENEGVYDVEIFDLGEDLSAKVVLVKNSNGATNVESPVAVVNKITTTINQKGDSVEKLYAAYNGKMIEIETTEKGILVNSDGETLKVGDIIQYRTTANGVIDRVTVLFEAANKAKEFKTVQGDMETVYGKVDKKFSNSINVSVEGESLQNYVIGEAKVISVDTTKTSNNVQIVSSGEIQKYDELSPQRVFIRLYNQEVQEIVIVK